MPELPEVETVRRGLEPVMAGRRIARVQQNRPDLRFPFPDNFTGRLEGQRVVALARRAKYLVVHLSGGEILAMHLGMSGRFSITPANASGPGRPIGEYEQDIGAHPAHDHVVFTMEDGATVTYNDPRRFGFMDLFPQSAFANHKLFANLGIEPLGNELNAAYIAEKAHGKATDLKAFLLDQRIIAGLGNIYVCEALFRSNLSPRRGADCLVKGRGGPTVRADRLVPVIRDVLNEAIVAGGSTLRDYKQTDGSLGYFQHRFRVYGRAGEACVTPGCSRVIERIVQSGRSTFFCPSCQR